MYLKKKLIIIIVFAVLMMSLSGCNSTPSKMSDAIKTKQTDIPNVVKATEPRNTAEPKTVESTKSIVPSQVETTTNPEGTKAWGFYIQEVTRNYEILVIEAINNNDFSLIENLLIPNSNLYNSQKKLITDLYTKNIKEKLVDFSIENIQETEKDGVFKIFVNESIGIKYSGKVNFETKEYKWIYTLVKNKDSIGLSNIEEWS